MEIRELWSEQDEAQLDAFSRAVAIEDLVGALHAVAGASPEQVHRSSETLAAAARVARTQVNQGPPPGDGIAAGISSLGLGGGASDLNEPRGASIHEVLAHRHGHPLALVAIALDIARRAHIDADAVLIPGAFLLRVGGESGVLVDPRGAAVLSQEQCEAIVELASGGEQVYDPDRVHSVGLVDLAAAMLQHLAALRGVRDDLRELYRVLGFACVLRPDDPQLTLQRAALADRLGAFGLAHGLYREVERRFFGTAAADQARSMMGGEVRLLN